MHRCQSFCITSQRIHYSDHLKQNQHWFWGGGGGVRVQVIHIVCFAKIPWFMRMIVWNGCFRWRLCLLSFSVCCALCPRFHIRQLGYDIPVCLQLFYWHTQLFLFCTGWCHVGHLSHFCKHFVSCYLTFLYQHHEITEWYALSHCCNIIQWVLYYLMTFVVHSNKTLQYTCNVFTFHSAVITIPVTVT